MTCDAPVDYTVRSPDRELHVCSNHLAWARKVIPTGLVIGQVSPAGYRYVVSSCRAPTEES